MKSYLFSKLQNFKKEIEKFLKIGCINIDIGGMDKQQKTLFVVL